MKTDPPIPVTLVDRLQVLADSIAAQHPLTPLSVYAAETLRLAKQRPTPDTAMLEKLGKLEEEAMYHGTLTLWVKLDDVISIIRQHQVGSAATRENSVIPATDNGTSMGYMASERTAVRPSGYSEDTHPENPTKAAATTDTGLAAPKDSSAPIAGRSCEISDVWEYFCDRNYYDQWVVHEKGETKWGYCFHVPTLKEAKGLAEVLNAKPEPVSGSPVKHDLYDALRWVLPMAKGYAAKNRVGNNQELIEFAEDVLLRMEKHD